MAARSVVLHTVQGKTFLGFFFGGGGGGWSGYGEGGDGGVMYGNANNSFRYFYLK